MKITKGRLKQIIHEEVARALNEDPDTDDSGALDSKELRALADQLEDAADEESESDDYSKMSDDELLDKLPIGTMQPRMGGPGRDLFVGVKEDDDAPSPSEDLKQVMDKWKSVQSIPGATLKIMRYPSDYKKRHRFDRGRPNMVWGDVNYPSLG